MSENIQTQVMTTPTRFKERVAYDSDNEQVHLTPTTASDRTADITTTSPNIDTVANLRASVSTDSTSQGFKLVSVSEFKYDLLSPEYDPEKFTVDREVEDSKIIFRITPKVSIESGSHILNIFYPITLPSRLESLTDGWTLSKYPGQSASELISTNALDADAEYTVEVRSVLDLSALDAHIFINGGGAI